MATVKQINANRQNAKKSPGPRTSEGKAKVALNALKHGLLAKAALLPDEDEAAFRSFADDLLTELKPVGALESLLAEQIINLAWRLQRASLVEAGLLVRERALADEQWFREQQLPLELRHGDAELRKTLLAMGHVPDDEVIDVLDEARHAELGRQSAEAAAIARSDLARLADAFTRDAAGADAFSKLGRYETAIARRLTSTLTELEALQAERR
jgi:hypothetical protein